MNNIKISFLILLITMFAGNLFYAQDWPDLNHFREANAKLEASATDENRVVFMGNSITIGWKNICPDFFSNKSYINRGISGQTTPQMLIRFRADVIDLEPAVVVILAGTNDIAGNTGPATLKMIRDNIVSMIELAQANGIRVVISSILPVYDYPWKPGLEPAEKIVKLNKFFKSYAEKSGCLYLDYFSSLVDERKGMKEKYASDGVHPNKAGYKVMEPLAEEAIKRALSKNVKGK